MAKSQALAQGLQALASGALVGYGVVVLRRRQPDH
jgi:hypothetical protein